MESYQVLLLLFIVYVTGLTLHITIRSRNKNK